jgi:transcriptional regulator with XRE-family HTH domain
MRAKKKQVQPRSGPERAFGEILRMRRKRIGFSQEKLAFETGFDRTTISLMERGLLSPTLRTMVRLCKSIRLRLSEFAKQIEDSPYF